MFCGGRSRRRERSGPGAETVLAARGTICYRCFGKSNGFRCAEFPESAGLPAGRRKLLAANNLQRATAVFEQRVTTGGVVVLATEANPGPARRKAVELSAFFERLRQVLDDREMSQADLARELGVGVATVSEWFTRGRVPNGDVMLRLPYTLRVNGHWLLTGEGPRDQERRRGADPYLLGAQDAVSYMARCLEEVARRFGTEVVPPPPAGGEPEPEIPHTQG